MVNCGMRYNVKELLVLTHKEHYYYTWIEYKKGLLDSVIVGKLNHDLRTKIFFKLLEWVNV